MDKQDLVSVYTVNNAAEAEIVRSSLESVGIPCSIGGESQAGLAGVLEIDLLTSAEDADRARKHLKLLRHEKKERRKAQIEKQKAKEANLKSEAIQELKPPTQPEA
jgi:Putative prokaryotic signal transducing protein